MPHSAHCRDCTAATPQPEARGAPRGTVSVLCRYLKNSLHVFVSGGAIGTSFPPPRVLRRCWTTCPSLLVPLPLGQGAWAQQGRCQPSGLINQSLYIMYIALTSVSPLSCSGFASLMPACCNRPSRPIPSYRQQLPEETGSRSSHVFCQPGLVEWAPCYLLSAASRRRLVLGSHPSLGPMPPPFPAQLSSFPIPWPYPFWQLGKPGLEVGLGFPL